MKIIITLILGVFLSGCGSGKTYTTTEPASPGVPTQNGDVIIISNEGSETNVQYTQVGDGSVLVECGDNCTVNIAIIESDDNETEELP